MDSILVVDTLTFFWNFSVLIDPDLAGVFVWNIELGKLLIFAVWKVISPYLCKYTGQILIA